MFSYICLSVFICLLRALSRLPGRSTDSSKGWQNIHPATAGERAVTVLSAFMSSLLQ